MANVLSATTWGSPTAKKHALLLHGMTLSSHCWHRVATSLATHGYFVTAPNLVGHISRAATDCSVSAIAADLRPYLDARDYSLIIGHSLGAVTALFLTSYLSPSHPTAIILVDPPLKVPPEVIQFLDGEFHEFCTNTKPADADKVEHPLWTREDGIYRELGNRLCSVEAAHTILEKNKPWHFLDLLNVASRERKVTVLLADPAIFKVCAIEDLNRYPHVRSIIVPGAGHCIQNEFPEVIVDEALKTVGELEKPRCRSMSVGFVLKLKRSLCMAVTKSNHER